MKIFKEVFARIWALWGLLSFITTFLLALLAAFLTDFYPAPKNHILFARISRVWMNIWLFLVACPVKVQGRNHFKKGETYVVIFNHNSLMDVPLSYPYVPGINKTIAKTSFAKVPLFGFYYKKGSVLVDRKSESSRKSSYQRMKDVLAEGFHMCIYPEGTRNKTGKVLASFHSGAFRLSAETGHAILPAVIFNTKRVLPVNKPFYFMPHTLELHFLPPIFPQYGESAEQLRDRSHQVMENYLLAHPEKN